jgi:hypothetical protein
LGTDARPLAPPPVSRNFLEGFVAGSVQEGKNFGNIADIATGKDGTFGASRKEVGTAVVDLPFAVGGALLTKQSEQGKGFFGLGFDFDVNLDRALQKSGEEQKFIAEEFERDPSRAIGSSVTALGIEVALLVGSGGVANVARKGIIKTADFAIDTKRAKIVYDVAKKTTLKGEEDIPILIERKGNKYIIARGTDELAGLGAKVISPAEAVITQITKAGKVITSKVPLLKQTKTTKFGNTSISVTKQIKPKESDIQKLIKEKGLKPNPADPRSARDQAIAELQKSIKSTVKKGESERPVTIVEFGTKKGEQSIVKFFTKNIPKDKGNIDTRGVVITGVNDSTRFLSKEVQRQTGLRLVEIVTKLPKADSKLTKFKNRFRKKDEIDKYTEVLKRSEESTTVAGKPSKIRELIDVDGEVKTLPSTLDLIKKGEEIGFFELSARGIVFTLDEVVKNPKLVSKLVQTQRTLTGGRNIAKPQTVKEFEKMQSKGIEPRNRKDTKPLLLITEDYFQAKALDVNKIISGLGTESTKGGVKKSVSTTAKDTGKQGGKKSADDTSKSADNTSKKGKGNESGSGQTTVFEEAVESTVKITPQTKNSLSGIRSILESTTKTTKKSSKVSDDVVRTTNAGLRSTVFSSTALSSSQIFDPFQQQTPQQKTRDKLNISVIPLIDTINPLDTKKDDKENKPFIFERPQIKTPNEKTRTTPIITPRLTTDQIVGEVPITTTITVPEITTTTIPKPDPPFTPPVVGGGGLGFGFPPFPSGLSKKQSSTRPSGQGKRLFDVADTPFGKVTVGLGFFIEQKGDETIAESLGLPEPVERKAKRKKAPDPLTAVFGEQSGQFDTTFRF